MEQSTVTVLYGSQTGNAADVARRIGSELRKTGLIVLVRNCHDYSVRNLPDEKWLVIVVSTTGQGDPPDSFRGFWRMLCLKSLPETLLKRVNCTVFGLGDSSYPKYNIVARKLYQRLLNLGATSLLSRGLGDDCHDFGYDSELDPWIEKLIKAVVLKIPGANSIASETWRDPFAKPNSFKYCVRQRRNKDLKPDQGGWPMYGYGSKRYTPYLAHLQTNKRLTPDDHWQDVRQIEVTFGDSGLKYSPGDVLLVHPQNPMKDVMDILSYVGLEPSQCVSVERLDSSAPELQLPAVMTAQALFQRHLDICGVPRRAFFKSMIPFTRDLLQRERLIEFVTTADGQVDLYKYCTREARTYIEVLNDFSSTKIPLNHLIGLLPQLRPRKFSISSAMEMCPWGAQLTVALVEYLTPYNRPRKGLCSQFFAQAKPGDKIPIWVENGSFRLPKDFLTRPLILVGPGTGIAPCRSFCQQRHALRLNGQKDIAPAVVFFGNRNRLKDFLHESDWEEMKKSSTVSHMFTAFSRDQDEKVYVTRRIREQRELVGRLLKSSNAMVLVAGASGQMPRDVRAAFVDTVDEQVPGRSGEAIIKQLERSYRYQRETWG